MQLGPELGCKSKVTVNCHISVRAEPKAEQLSIDLIGKNEVYGDTRHEVNVYVKVSTNSPFLVCMDLALSQEKIIDPKYLWIGPDGRNLKGHRSAELAEPGKLVLVGFRESMSGAYTCSLSHTLIEATTQEETEMVEAYKFMVYAYREADHAYQVFVRFSTSHCRLRANTLYFETLKQILNRTISHLKCHITESSCKCHSIRTPKQGLQHELFVNFQVHPFAPGLEEVCHKVPDGCEDVTNMRVQQVLCQSPRAFSASLTPPSASAPAEATEQIGKFFLQLRDALKHQVEAVPTIQFVENSFSMTPIDSCRPGFGKDRHSHQSCASCCDIR
ncbi:Zona pellucida-binding protein 2 [Willisornis vidua]|uniref:Zona pellucida-binding protein 2 n=1 Tax=Willisornis vidua TaxID=1566151 RepID=A0ABQ9D7U6_9PASS|nr:Zona pellucida-binding protein 2 [Willisornis vidua]